MITFESKIYKYGNITKNIESPTTRRICNNTYESELARLVTERYVCKIGRQ